MIQATPTNYTITRLASFEKNPLQKKGLLIGLGSSRKPLDFYTHYTAPQKLAENTSVKPLDDSAEPHFMTQSVKSANSQLMVTFYITVTKPCPIQLNLLL